MSTNVSGNRPSPERPSAMPDWRIECRGCGAWLATHLRDDIVRWLAFHLHTEPASNDPQASSNCGSTSADSSVTRSEVSTNLNGNDPSRTTS